MTAEYITRVTNPNGSTRLEVTNDSAIDTAVRKFDEKHGYKYETLEKLHENFNTEALAKYFKI